MSEQEQKVKCESEHCGSGSDSTALLCGCGKPARYLTFKNGDIQEGACNKYRRCMTREELESALRTAKNRLSMYQKAVNEIDDYFEYAMESKKDQKHVHKVLGNLTDALSAT